MTRRFLARLALKNLTRYRRRTIITSFAIAGGLAIFVGMDSMLQSMADESYLNLAHYETGSAQIAADGYWEEHEQRPLDLTVSDPESIVRSLAEEDIDAAPRIVFRGELVVRYDPFPEDGSVRMDFVGVDPEREARALRVADHIVEGQWLESDGEQVLLGRWLADRLGAEVGYPITVLTRTRDGFHQIIDLEVAGIYETPNPQLDRSTAFLPIALADEYLEMDGAATSVVLSLSGGIPTEAALDEVRSAVDLSSLELLDFETLGAEIAGISETQRRISAVFLMLLALIAVVGIVNTMLMAVTERRREIGMMRAVGLRDREIRNVFAWEAAGIASIGAAGGIVLGALVVWYLSTVGLDMRALVQDADVGYRSAGIVRGAWRPGIMVAAAAVAVLVAALASRFPLRSMIGEPIPDSLRAIAADKSSVGVEGLAGKVAARRTGLWALALRNIFRHGRRTALSICAIAVAAMSVLLFVGTMRGMQEDMMGNSFNFAEGEIRIRNENFDRYEYMNPVHYVVEEYRGLVERLHGLDDVQAVSPRVVAPAAAFRGERLITARGLGIDLDLERQYQDIDKLVVSGRAPEAGEPEALLGVRLAERLGVEPGDTVTFQTQTRARRSNAFTVDVVGLAGFPVAAVDRTTFFMPIEPAARFLRMGDAATEVLVRSEDGDSAALTERINLDLLEHAPAEVRATSWMEAGYVYATIQLVDAWLVIFAAFFLAIAITVIVNTTLMAVRERTREIGTLSALGMRDRTIVGLFTTEAFYIGAIGTVIGVGLGIAFGAVLGVTGIDVSARMDAADINIASVIYPIISAPEVLIVAVVTLAVSTLAALAPSAAAARMRPVEALRDSG